ncbi:MAG: phage virion morphogenesis protein [Desulfitobacteriaceae bacterium]
MTLINLNQLMVKLAQAPHMIDAEMRLAVKKSARKVRDTAVKKFGSYQQAVGGLPAWAPLKPATIRRKARAGGGEDPLIGHYKVKSRNRIHGMPLMSSISDYVTDGGWTGVVGTDDPVGKHHEYGAPKANIPPRPFLRPALFEEQDFIREETSDAIKRTIMRL